MAYENSLEMRQAIMRQLAKGEWVRGESDELIAATFGVSPVTVRITKSECLRYLRQDLGSSEELATEISMRAERVYREALDSGDPKALPSAIAALRLEADLLGASRSPAEVVVMHRMASREIAELTDAELAAQIEEVRRRLPAGNVIDVEGKE